MTGINAHFWTKGFYYWIRAVSDPQWGMSGFLYVAGGKQTYYLLPLEIDIISPTEAIVSAIVKVGGVDGKLEIDLSNTGGILSAGYEVISIADPSVVLDSADITDSIITAGRQYLRIIQ